MNTVINQNLFRYREAASAGINNLCTLVHHVKKEGDYLGEVVHRKRVLGTFRLRYQRSYEGSQVNVDLSRFDEIFRINTPGQFLTEYELGGEGYVVFHASGHHSELYVTLTRTGSEEKKEKEQEKPVVTFDSRKLGAEDIVVFRLWHPGAYTLANVQGKQKASLKVTGAVEGKFSKPGEPAKATLTDKGFDPEHLSIAATQALVITVQTPASLTLTRDKDAKPDDYGKTPKAPPARNKRQSSA